MVVDVAFVFLGMDGKTGWNYLKRICLKICWLVEWTPWNLWFSVGIMEGTKLRITMIGDSIYKLFPHIGSINAVNFTTPNPWVKIIYARLKTTIPILETKHVAWYQLEITWDNNNSCSDPKSHQENNNKFELQVYPIWKTKHISPTPTDLHQSPMFTSFWTVAIIVIDSHWYFKYLMSRVISVSTKWHVITSYFSPQMSVFLLLLWLLISPQFFGRAT